jgi:hypothetical protein
MRAALCFSGRASKDSEFCLKNLQRHFIAPLEELGYDVDIFAHLWEVDDWERVLDRLNPTDYCTEADRSEELRLAHERRIFGKHQAKIDELNPNVARGKMFWYPYTPNMFLSIYEANRLKTNFEKAEGFTYDLVARMRTDNISQEGSYKSQLERVVDCPTDELWVPTDYVGSAEPVAPEFDYVVDNFAIGGSKALDAYAETYWNLDDFFDIGFKRYQPHNWPKLKLKGAYWLCGTMVGYSLKKEGIRVMPRLEPGFTVLRKTAARAEVAHRRGQPTNKVMDEWLRYKGIK